MIDSHLHLQDPVFRDQTQVVIERLREIGVSDLVVNGTSPEDWQQVARLAASFEEVIPFYGLHPWKVKDGERRWIDELRLCLENDDRAGVGEIGLDRWIRNHDLPRQREVFMEQLVLAHELGRPVTIHCLKAWGGLADCLSESPFCGPLLLHSFSGPAEMVSHFVKQGAFFSISGYFFREDKLDRLEVFREVPEERILLETDAPDMLPPSQLIRYPLSRPGAEEPVNHPANLVTIYEAYAEWSGSEVEEVIQRMRGNFRNWNRCG